MGKFREYSKRLGAISDAQFEAVAARWNLGRFVRAAPVTNGLFGQNVFVTTSDGEFVLRGAPHWVKGPDDSEWRREDRWQFSKEKFFAQLLHERTKAPAPWPMLHDEASDIFGWPYLVMPRMPGQCFDERSIRKSLDREDRRGVAIALSEMLAEMQTLTWPFAGDFGEASIQLEPNPDGVIGQALAETRMIVRSAAERGTLISDEIAWIETLAQTALAAASERPNTYAHCDYKLNNLTVMKVNETWHVAGLFDFHEARFADGALDIVRQACAYFDSDPEQARVFVRAYLGSVAPDRRIRELMPFFVANDRLKFWDFFARPEARASWTEGKTFRGWAQHYMDAVMELL
jgi:hypothetical protein